MITAAPEITFTRDGIDWQWRGFVSVLAIKSGICGGQQPVQLHAGEAKHIEIHRGIITDARDLSRQQRLVPARIERNLIISEPQRARLRFGEMRQPNGGDTRHAEPLGGHDATMTCDQDARAIHQHRIHKSEFSD